MRKLGAIVPPVNPHFNFNNRVLFQSRGRVLGGVNNPDMSFDERRRERYRRLQNDKEARRPRQDANNPAQNRRQEDNNNRPNQRPGLHNYLNNRAQHTLVIGRPPVIHPLPQIEPINPLIFPIPPRARIGPDINQNERIIIPEPTDPTILNDLPTKTPELAENVYRKVKALIPDIKKAWVIERAGHGVEDLVNYILDNYYHVPMEATEAHKDNNCDISMDEENDEIEPTELVKEDDHITSIVNSLRLYILERLKKVGKPIHRRRILRNFLKSNYPFLKSMTIESLKLAEMDIRVVFAVCELLNRKKLTRIMASEFGVEYLWKPNRVIGGFCTPWLLLATNGGRRHQSDVIPLDGCFTAAFDEVQENAIKNIPKYSCCVCFDEFSSKQVISCSGSSMDIIDIDRTEDHCVCHECMRHHAAALCNDGQLADGGQGLKCLEPTCKRIFAWARVKVLLDKDVRTRLGKRIDNEALLNIESLESCKQCSFAVFFEAPVEVNKVFDCAKCHAQFCRICKYDWKDHMGRRCDEMKNFENEKDTQRKRLEEELANAVLRNCHRCKLVFSKDEGCNKMTCRCGATQCYICRAQDIGYDHFCQHIRDPNQPGCPENCRSCLLWADQETINREALQQVRQRAATNLEMYEHIRKL